MAGVTVYLGLGSNLGDRKTNLLRGIECLRCGIQVSQVSPIYETDPVGYTEQPPFLNCACKGETLLTPRELLALAKEAEAALGRVPTFRNGPRSLDVDILFYGDAVVSEPGLEVPDPVQSTYLLPADAKPALWLEVPHPRLTERRFVLEPLADIAPDLRHPILGSTISEMLEKLIGELEATTGSNEPKRIDPEVTVVKCIDGDSLMVQFVGGGLPFELRLFGVDAPEYKAAFGPLAKATLERLTENRTFRLAVVESSDGFRRSVGILYSHEYRDSINHKMVEAGMAENFTKFGSLPGILLCLEAAKKNKLGIWSQTNLV